MILTMQDDDTVEVAMGVPEFHPARIPFIAQDAADNANDNSSANASECPVHLLDVDGATVEICALAIGNPHAVQRVDDVQSAPVAAQGPKIENHPRFPARVNAGFLQVMARDRIRLRVHERGAGETPGCGSGACAAAAAGMRRGWLDARVTVALPGGEVETRWDGPGAQIFLRGPAHSVFTGVVEL